jgi:replicative DNA helicase
MHMAAHRLDQEEWNRAHSTLQTFQNMKMGINGETGGSWEQVEAAVKHGCRMKGVDCVFVDYIQQFHVMSKKLSIREEINYMTSRAKQLAMDFKIPFFIVAQLNREVEKRQGKPPLLSDIKESSSIENDSDVVLLLYKTKENVDDLPNFQEDLWIKIAKNRSGMCGSTEVGVDFSKNKILQKQKENEYEQRIKHI